MTFEKDVNRKIISVEETQIRRNDYE